MSRPSDRIVACVTGSYQHVHLMSWQTLATKLKSLEVRSLTPVNFVKKSYSASSNVCSSQESLIQELLIGVLP